jgi:serine/threonine protein kinase
MKSTMMNGTRNWQSKEMLESDTFSARQNDVWCLGALVYYILIGKHPYSGAGSSIEDNIKINKPCDFDMFRQQLNFDVASSRGNNMTKEGFERGSLFEAMSLLRLTFREELKRSTAPQLLKHPFMWSLAHKGLFLRKLEEATRVDKVLISKINQLYLWNPREHEHWIDFLDTKVIDHLNSSGWKYSANPVSLLQAIRNLLLSTSLLSATTASSTLPSFVLPSVSGVGLSTLENATSKKLLLELLGSDVIELFVKTFPKLVVQLWKATRKHLDELDSQAKTLQTTLSLGG